jgi:hypothetical protein
VVFNRSWFSNFRQGRHQGEGEDGAATIFVGFMVAFCLRNYGTVGVLGAEQRSLAVRCSPPRSPTGCIANGSSSARVVAGGFDAAMTQLIGLFGFIASAMIACCLIIGVMGPATTRLRLEQISR